MAKDVVFELNEGEDVDFSFISNYDATGKTVRFLYRAEGGSGSATTAGTVSGEAANTKTTITCTLNNLSPGTYDFWVYSGYQTADQKLLVPNNDEVSKFKINARI